MGIDCVKEFSSSRTTAVGLEGSRGWST